MEISLVFLVLFCHLKEFIVITISIFDGSASLDFMQFGHYVILDLLF